MATRKRARPPQKTGPEAPEAPVRWERVAVVESGATWDGMHADADVVVPGHVADLSLRECRWVDADLSGRTFTGLRARDVRFVDCDLSGAVLHDAVLTRVAFSGCRMTGIGLDGAELRDVHIQDSRADLGSLRMAKGRFLLVEDTSLHAADFYGFTGEDCGLVGCDLSGASFDDARIAGTDLHGSALDDIRGALHLRGTRISADQLVPLGAALVGAMGIEVTERAG